MDLRKADIDITGAEESLRAAEQAIEERNFDDVDAILTDLDATAKELMGELVAASRNLIGRAERKIHEGRDAGLDVDKAVAHLDTAEAAFERGEYADAVEHARSAEKEVADGSGKCRVDRPKPAGSPKRPRGRRWLQIGRASCRERVGM